MKSYIQLTNLANTYYDAWTSDGIDSFHTDENEIKAWLTNTDIRTERDEALEELTDDEIATVASLIAEKVADALKELDNASDEA